MLLAALRSADLLPPVLTIECLAASPDVGCAVLTVTRPVEATKRSTRRTKRSHSSVSARWCLYWAETLHSRLSVPAGSNASRVQSFVATRSRRARLRVPSSASARSYPRQARS